MRTNGSQCKRKVNGGEKYCWQHAHGVKHRWRALTRNQAFLFLLTILFGIASTYGAYIGYVTWTESKPSDSGWSASLTSTVNDVLTLLDSVPRPWVKDGGVAYDYLPTLNKRLERDPYDTPALILRAQIYHFHSEAEDGNDFREAIADYQRAAEIDHKIGDPHFGLGRILYHLGLFDLVKRGRYEIRGKGTLTFDPETGQMVKKRPDFALLPDDRNRILLQGALDEYEKGLHLGQFYARTEHGVVGFFSSENVQEDVQSVQCEVQRTENSTAASVIGNPDRGASPQKINSLMH